MALNAGSNFEGIGYIGGVSIVLGAGVTMGGGIKFPNDPLIPGDLLDTNYGGIRIGVGHNLCFFKYLGGT